MDFQIIEESGSAVDLFERLINLGLYLHPYSHREESILPCAKDQYTTDKFTPKALNEKLQLFTEKHLLNDMAAWRADGISEEYDQEKYDTELAETLETFDNWSYLDGKSSRLGIVSKSNFDALVFYCKPSKLSKNLSLILGERASTSILENTLDVITEGVGEEYTCQFEGNILYEIHSEHAEEGSWLNDNEMAILEKLCEKTVKCAKRRLKSLGSVKCFEITSSTLYPALQFPNSYFVLADMNKTDGVIDVQAFHRFFESY